MNNLIYKCKASTHYKIFIFIIISFFYINNLNLLSSDSLNLTPEEQNWLKEHPVVRVAFDHNWAPVEFIDEDGKPSGASWDYLQIFEKALGITFQITADKPWGDMFEDVKKGELDIASGISIVKEREQFINFTEEYCDLYIGIFTGKKIDYIGSLKELSYKKVAVVKGYFIVEELKKANPEIELVLVDSIQEGLLKLDREEIDAVIDAALIVNYYVNMLDLSNIKIAGVAPFSFHIGIACRKDWAPLVNILNKVIHSISEQERNAIYNKWVEHKYKRIIDYHTLIQLLAVAFIIITFFALWNWRLRKEIKARKIAENKLEEYKDNLEAIIEERTLELHEAMLELKESNDELLTLNFQMADKSRSIELLNADLEKVIATKDRFFSIIAHDLRNPFSALLTNSEMLEEFFYKFDNNEKLKLITSIKNAASFTYSLLENLLTWARTQKGNIDFSPDYYDINKLLFFNFLFLNHLAQKKEITISITCNQNEFVYCDKEMIDTVVRNLLSNAIKFTPKGGIIKISAQKQEAWVVFSISDNGIGMDKDMLNKLFQIDHKITRSGTEHEISTGLGLILCKEFIDKHNGKIWADSEEGKGTTFYFSLPIIDLSNIILE